MSDDEIFAYIRECLENGNYDYEDEHLDDHFFAEGFDIDDVIHVVMENDPYRDTSARFALRFSPIGEE